MTESATQASTSTTTVFVHRVFIKAPPQMVWDAITDPEWNERYGYQCRADYDLRPGGAYQALANQAMKDFGAPDVIIDGEVIEVQAPHRLVQTWRGLFSPELAAEGFTRLTWELDEQPGGITRLTLTHDVQNAPLTRAQISGENVEAGGGWSLIISDLKTLLETGKTFQG